MNNEIDMGWVGAGIAAIGGVFVVANWSSNNVEAGLIVGGFLIIAGLLLRIESAVRDLRSRD